MASDELDLFDSPLPQLFSAAEKTVGEAEFLPSNSPETAEKISRALTILKQCRSRVDSLGLFSRNDEVEDISTADLKYLLIDFYAGDLGSRSPAREPRERLGTLLEASFFLKTFLGKCDGLSIAGPEAKAITDREEGAKADPNTLRMEKIARFKREKELREKLARIQQLIDAASAPRARKGGEADGESPASGRVVEEGEEAVEVAGAVDEETVRDLYLTRLQHACVKAVDLIKSLDQEIEILKHAVKNPGPAPPPQFPPGMIGPGAGAGPGGNPFPRDMSIIKQLAAAADQLKDRERIRAEVFRPGYNLPTMTLQELAEEEMAEATEREARQNKAAMARRRKEEAHEEWGEDEDLIRKARDWDDFKDDNPFGHGNSAVRPLR